MNQLRSQNSNRLNLFELRVQFGRGFKLQFLGSPVALLANRDKLAFATRSKKAAHGFGFLGIASISAALLAGREAHLHLAIDAAGMFRVRREIVFAAAQQKELQQFFAVTLGSRARREWPEGPL